MRSANTAFWIVLILNIILIAAVVAGVALVVFKLLVHFGIW